MVHILHAAEIVDFGNKGTVAEGIGRKVDEQAVRVHAPDLLKIVLGVGDVPQETLGGGHILVRLHPGGSGDLPAALPDALFDLLHHIGVVFLHHFVDGGLGLREGKLRVLLHQIQHRPEGGQGGCNRLMVRPHPVHIQMGMARQDELVFLRRLGAGHQQFLCLAAGTFRQNAVQLVTAKQIG